MKLALIIGVSALVLVAIAVVYYFPRQRQVTQDLSRAQEEAKAVLEKATAEANQLTQKASAEVNERSRNFEEEFDRQTRDRRKKINEMERRLVNKEENLDPGCQAMEREEAGISGRERRG